MACNNMQRYFSYLCHPVAVHEPGPKPARECVVHHGVGDVGAAPAGPPAQRQPAVAGRPGKVGPAPSSFRLLQTPGGVHCVDVAGGHTSYYRSGFTVSGGPVDAGHVFRVKDFTELATPVRCRHLTADLLLIMVTRLLLFN